MRGRTPNRCDYTVDRARNELGRGVHWSVVACRMGVSEADLALALDLRPAEVVAVYEEVLEVAR